MKTIKLVFILLAMVCMAAVSAQEKKVVLGIKAGLNLSNVGDYEYGYYDNTRVKPGFHAGLTLDFAFSPHWYLLTGLEYTAKGFRAKSYIDNLKVTAGYMQIPLLGAYKFLILDDLSIMINTGPYFAYGVNGDMKMGRIKSDTFSDDGFRRFDCGVNLGVTLEWRKLCFSLNGEVGFIDMLHDNWERTANRNSTFSIGYKF